MQESERLILVGMVSGLSLPEGVNELSLDRASIFQNPAAIRALGGPPEMGPNTAIYSGEGNERRFVGEVATYLIELKSEAPGSVLGHTRIKGTGGVTITDLSQLRGRHFNHRQIDSLGSEYICSAW